LAFVRFLVVNVSTLGAGDDARFVLITFATRCSAVGAGKDLDLAQGASATRARTTIFDVELLALGLGTTLLPLGWHDLHSDYQPLGKVEHLLPDDVRQANINSEKLSVMRKNKTILRHFLYLSKFLVAIPSLLRTMRAVLHF
jgi:hypothetical protein